MRDKRQEQTVRNRNDNRINVLNVKQEQLQRLCKRQRDQRERRVSRSLQRLNEDTRCGKEESIRVG